ncbi:MAG: dephospho-CoA kinase [Polyangiaceae bacterium]
MRVFGLTGGIASGKTTVARRFEERGVPVVYADELARQAVEPGSPGLAAIVDAFGDDVLAADGSLDRKKLGARVFNDESARKRLNSIVHPRVAALAMAAFAEHAARGTKLLCYEVPLLIENNLQDAFRPVVLVAASEQNQLRRAADRDSLSEDDALARVRSQLPLADKLRVADFVIRNDGTRDELIAAVDALVERLRVDPPNT